MGDYKNHHQLIMRHLYLDEAGIGNPNIEPYTVVAGVWHGSGFFPRSDWPLARRLEILNHLADIPSKFELPIIYSCLKREEFVPKELTGKKRALADKKCHCTCFSHCLSLADKWMEQFCREEKVFAIVEMHRDHRSGLHLVADVLNDPRLKGMIQKEKVLGIGPLDHFVETPLFAEKSGNSPLQIADTCAFILSKALADAEHSAPLLKKIEPRLVNGFIREFFRREPGEKEVF